MTCFKYIPIPAFLLVGIAGAPDKVNQNALIVQDFQKRVADYVTVHKKARGEIHGLKPTPSPEAITHYEHQLAHRIRELRGDAKQGAIFTPGISGEFRRLIAMSMQGSGAARVRQSLRHEPPPPRVSVNSAYPAGAPLPTTPPSFLLNLPQLPPEVEYRVVDHDLLLRDIDANLIVDLIRNAVP